MHDIYFQELEAKLDVFNITVCRQLAETKVVDFVGWVCEWRDSRMRIDLTPSPSHTHTHTQTHTHTHTPGQTSEDREGETKEGGVQWRMVGVGHRVGKRGIH